MRKSEFLLSYMSMTGRVFWITALAGGGKTTLANALGKRLKTPLHLDGDALRKALNNYDYSLEGRMALAMNYARLCHLFSKQGFDVICATISMFDEPRAWMRNNIPNYFEIYLKVEADELKRRNQKRLYSEGSSVAGVDIPIELPKSPDLVIENNGTKPIETFVEDILKCSKATSPHSQKSIKIEQATPIQS